MHRRQMVMVLISILWITTAFGLTLTPVWEITRPAEWAEIQYFGIHYDGSGDPLVVCRTDSGVFTVDHTGAQTMIWTFAEGDSTQFQSAVLSASGNYVAIITNRLEDEETWTWVGDIRVMDAEGALVWEVTGTAYRKIGLADVGPWSISTMPEYGEFDHVYHDYLIRDPSGAVSHEGIRPSHYNIAVSDDGTRFTYCTMDSVFELDSAGSILRVEPMQLPGLEGYNPEIDVSTPSHGFSVSYFSKGLPSPAGKIIFNDSTGAFGTPIDVAASWHADLDISDDGEHAVLGARGTLYCLTRATSSIEWSTTDPDGFQARSYRSVEISGDGSLVVGCASQGDSSSARLEIFDTAGTELYEESLPTIGVITAQMTPEGAYLVLRLEPPTWPDGDITLVLYEISL